MRPRDLATAIAGVAIILTMSNVAVTRADEDDVMMTGTIVSIDGDELRIRTPEGERVFRFGKGVDRPANLAAGTQVTMWVDEDDVDDNPPGEKVESETYTIHRMSVGSTVEPGSTVPPRTVTTEERAPAPERTTESPTTTTSATGTEPATESLPQAASPLAAVGIAGILALAGGLGLRIWKRRRAS